MEWQTGDLVWVRVASYPSWPGQVMDPKTAPNGAQKKRKPGHKLVSFFADNSFGWFKPETMLSFASALDEKAAAGKKTQHRKLFIQALEEATEIQDTRDGKQPLTSHNPLDFCVEEPEYDHAILRDIIPNMPFEKMFPPLDPYVAVALDPKAEVLKLRAQARNCESISQEDFQQTESLLMWFRFVVTLHPSVRQEVSAKYAKDLNFARPMLKLCKQSKQAADAGEEADEPSTIAAEPQAAKKAPSQRKLSAAKGSPSNRKKGKQAQGNKKEKGLSLKAVKRKRSEAASAEESDDLDDVPLSKTLKATERGHGKGGVKTDVKSEGSASARGKRRATAATSSLNDQDSGTNEGSDIDMLAAAINGDVGMEEFEASAPEWILPPKAETQDDDLQQDLAWPDGLPVYVIESDEHLQELQPLIPDVVPNLEEMAAEANVPLCPTKIKARKLLARVRQFARNVDNTEVHRKVLNVHNLAGLFKLREGCRPERGDASVCDSTRDALVTAWRENQEIAHNEWREVELDKEGNPKPPRPQPPLPPPLPDPQLPGPPSDHLAMFPEDVTICFAPDVVVPVHFLRHLPLLEPTSELLLLRQLKGFWRGRGVVLDPPVSGRMVVDISGVFRQIAERGGFWAVCAAQGTGDCMHEHENFTAWRLLTQLNWIAGSDEAVEVCPWAAARLQAWCRQWLLPFEVHLMQEHAGEVATAHFPAALIRRLAIERTQDCVLKVLVKYMAGLAASRKQEVVGKQLYGDAAFEHASIALANKLGQLEVSEMLSGFDVYRSAPPPAHALSETAAAPPAAAAATASADRPPPARRQRLSVNAARLRALEKGHAEPDSKTQISGDSEDSDDGETIPGPRWARQPRRGAKTARSGKAPASKPKGTSGMRAASKLAHADTGTTQDPKATFLAGPGGSGTGSHADAAKEEQQALPAETPPTKEALVSNPLKRQMPQSIARPDGGASAPPRQQSGNRYCVQVCFDQDYAMPQVSRVENVVKLKFDLLPKQKTLVAPADKFMMLFLHSKEEAHKAAQILPAVLNKGLNINQRITVTPYPTKHGFDIVSEAAQRRKQQSKQLHSRPAPPPRSGSGAAAPPPDRVLIEPAQAAWPGSVPQQPPPVYIIPHPAVVGSHSLPPGPPSHARVAPSVPVPLTAPPRSTVPPVPPRLSSGAPPGPLPGPPPRPPNRGPPPPPASAQSGGMTGLPEALQAAGGLQEGAGMNVLHPPHNDLKVDMKVDMQAVEAILHSAELIGDQAAAPVAGVQAGPPLLGIPVAPPPEPQEAVPHDTESTQMLGLLQQLSNKASTG